MKKLIVVVFLIITTQQCWASPESLRSVSIDASGKDGCYLSDGKQVLGSTIGLMVEAYNHHPKLPNQTIESVIQTAIDAGCNLNEKNNSGLSSLNAAILINEPKMVELLLSNGADPKLKIESSKKWVDGKDSFELYEFLKSRKDMAEMGKVLAQYRFFYNRVHLINSVHAGRIQG